MPRSSATDSQARPGPTHGAGDRDSVGRRYAEALGGKNFDRVLALLDPEIDFWGLTPRRTWEARDPSTVVQDVLRQWFDVTDEIEEIVSIETDSFADRQRVAYRFRGHNPGGPFVVEQQVYYTESDGRINWMRVLCSGFRPVDTVSTNPAG